VIGEVALSLMLLIGAGLLIRSFVRLQGVSPGFNPSQVISMRLGASGRQFQERSAAIDSSARSGTESRAYPGVKVRGAVSALPFRLPSGGDRSTSKASAAARPGAPGRSAGGDADYFRTMEIPVRKGRAFNDFDAQPNAEPVAIVTTSSRSVSGRTRIPSASTSGTTPNGR
jgi:putative ABC transport system permease protein